MEVAIVGADHVGVALDTALHRARHAIMCGVQKPDNAKPDQATVGIAVSDAEAVILAITFNAVDAATEAAGGFAGEVVIDATTPLEPPVVPAAASSELRRKGTVICSSSMKVLNCFLRRPVWAWAEGAPSGGQ